MLNKDNSHNQLKISKNSNFVEKIIVVDGMIGGGKTLISSIISSLPKVEMWLHKPKLEQICSLNYLNHITLNAAKSLINTWVNEEAYNLSISRNTNFRPSDISSVFQTNSPFRYFKRLFKNRLDAVENIKKNPLILNLMTHVNTSYANPFFEALGDKLLYIRVCRHPMSEYMIKHNENWINRWNKDERNGYILYQTFSGNQYSTHIPFFARKIESSYLNSNSTEKAILLFDQWIREGNNFIDRISKTTNATIIEIPYEKFVFEPKLYVDKIASSLGVFPDNKTAKELRKQGVPRDSLTDAPKSRNFKEFGWKPPKQKVSLAENFNQGRSYVAKFANQDILKLLDKLSEDYISRFDLKN